MLKKEQLTSTQLDIVKMSIFKAVEHGHVEFVTHMCEAHPRFLKLDDKNNKNIFQFAVECRQNKIYSLIHGLDKEDQRFFGLRVTTFPENMLHLAGNLSPLSRFNRIHGPSLQMQRELQWFKVSISKYICIYTYIYLEIRYQTNSQNLAYINFTLTIPTYVLKRIKHQP